MRSLPARYRVDRAFAPCPRLSWCAREGDGPSSVSPSIGVKGTNAGHVGPAQAGGGYLDFWLFWLCSALRLPAAGVVEGGSLAGKLSSTVLSDLVLCAFLAGLGAGFILVAAHRCSSASL